MMKEADVGITEFANTAQPISGILRCRYADFKVNEIDHEMNLAQLISVDAPDDGRFVEKQATFTDEAAISACVAAFSKDVRPDEAGNLLAFLKRLQQRVRFRRRVLACRPTAIAAPTLHFRHRGHQHE